MGYVGVKPSAVPLTSADIADSIITSAKIVDGTIVNADINASSAIAISKISATGTSLQVLRMNSGATALEFATPTSAANTPAFSAKPTSAQTITANTWTKVDLGTENVDSDGNFASSRFTPTTSGYYFINFKIYSNNANDYIYSAIYKNGSNFITGAIDASQAGGNSICAVVEFNGTTDYVEAYTFQGTSAGNIEAVNTQFSGFKLIGV
jgi:hypothetical protein